MRKISKRQEVIRELFMILFLLQLKETNRIVDSSLKMPLIPTIGSIISPNDAGKQLIIDLELEDSARKIFLHPVFYSNSHRSQLPIPHQLALNLEWLGSNGNGASIGRFLQNLLVGRGTVVK
ncbi:hypothetical protein PCANC_26774 [Puccinia coronata f. sp. avenae]|uniref:Uncharacterized protein n=1 Tax=Puccinia coronata f. sp. avenae TaxID=200324 RepID=A0A2N5TLP9_9BASI|nr:hypothetical protein PCANC_26774 [Puccinia coronata f. sp. avenae]